MANTQVGRWPHAWSAMGLHKDDSGFVVIALLCAALVSTCSTPSLCPTTAFATPKIGVTLATALQGNAAARPEHHMLEFIASTSARMCRLFRFMIDPEPYPVAAVNGTDPHGDAERAAASATLLFTNDQDCVAYAPAVRLFGGQLRFSDAPAPTPRNEIARVAGSPVPATHDMWRLFQVVEADPFLSTHQMANVYNQDPRAIFGATADMVGTLIQQIARMDAATAANLQQPYEAVMRCPGAMAWLAR